MARTRRWQDHWRELADRLRHFVRPDCAHRCTCECHRPILKRRRHELACYCVSCDLGHYGILIQDHEKHMILCHGKR